MDHRPVPRGSIPTLKYLNDLLTILDPDTNNVFLWPFLEDTGQLVQSYGGIDESVIPGIAATDTDLDDSVGFMPVRHPGGINSYHFEGAGDQQLAGDDAATLSFNGTTDAAFSVGCFFYIDSGTGTLIAKYDVAGTDREWRLHLLSGPDLALELYQEDIDDSETAQTTAALSTRKWYSGIVTYGGAGGDGAGGKTAAADMTIYIDGAAVAATTSEVGGTYADMVAGNAPLLIGANDDSAAPASEFTGRIALPFIVNAELTAAEVAGINSICRGLLGLV